MTRLIVYAGPNGSGKSSLRDTGQQSDPVDVVIDPDRIARALNPIDPRAVDRAAGREALMLFESTLAARRSMSLETTLSGRSILIRLHAAKASGYRIELYFIALDAAELNIQRVQARASKGGHSIAPADIRRRYVSSLANLPKALLIADRATLIDNSGMLPVPVVETRDGTVVRSADVLPRWLAPLMPSIRAAGLAG